MKELEQEDVVITDAVDPKDDEGECRMCKFIFFFAFALIFLTIIFTYFFKLHASSSIQPLPQEQVHPVSDTEWQARILELKNTAEGNTSASSTR